MYLVNDALTYDIHSRLSRAFDDCILPQNIELSPQPSKASQTRRPCPWTAPGNRAVTRWRRLVPGGSMALQC